MNRDSKRLGKLVGFLKLSSLTHDGDMEILKKSLSVAKHKEDPSVTAIKKDAAGDPGYANKSMNANLKPLKNQGKLQIFDVSRIGMPKLSNYDPDVEFYEDMNDQWGDGPGNASHNEDTQPPPDDTNDPVALNQIYAVNSTGASGAAQAWGELDGRQKVTSGGLAIPATSRNYRGA